MSSSIIEAKPELNAEQELALDQIEAFVRGKSDKNVLFTLKGYAGTGKTFTITRLVERLGERYYTVFTAPTNKAVRVLRQYLDGIGSKRPTATIHSLLGLSMEANGAVKKLFKPKGLEAAFSSFDVIIVDEASMVNQEIYEMILEEAINAGNKVIFLGDPAQLPPVKELNSPVFTAVENVAELTQIMRYDNDILKLATELRGKVNAMFPTIQLLDWRSESLAQEGIMVLSRSHFESDIQSMAASGQFLKPDQVKVISWRNITVDKYNRLIRTTMFSANPSQWELTDRIIATGPCSDKEDRLLTTDEEAVIVGIKAKPHSVYPQYDSVQLQVERSDRTKVYLQVLTTAGNAELQKELGKLKKAMEWPKFWSLIEAFHPIRHAYAITAHRSQGSTYDTVFVDSADILCNRNRQEAFRCLYVACTRAKRFVIIT